MRSPPPRDHRSTRSLHGPRDPLAIDRTLRRLRCNRRSPASRRRTVYLPILLSAPRTARLRRVVDSAPRVPRLLSRDTTGRGIPRRRRVHIPAVHTSYGGVLIDTPSSYTARTRYLWVAAVS